MTKAEALKLDGAAAQPATSAPETGVHGAGASAAVRADDEAPAVWKKPAELRPWTKNPKPIEGKHIREMKRSIRRFGFGAPIVARAANLEIIEGHLRHAAALAMRLDRVPVRLLDISADEAHMLAIAAWKFEHRRDADEAEVAAILDDLDERGVDIEHGTGFEDKELDKLLAKNASEEGAAGEGATSNVRGHKRRLRTGGLTYRIVVDCTDEMHQVKLLEKLEGEGLSCKPLIS